MTELELNQGVANELFDEEEKELQEVTETASAFSSMGNAKVEVPQLPPPTTAAAAQAATTLPPKFLLHCEAHIQDQHGLTVVRYLVPCDDPEQVAQMRTNVLETRAVKSEAFTAEALMQAMRELRGGALRFTP